MSKICRCRWFLQMSTWYGRHLYGPLTHSHAGQPLGRKTSYIQIAREDLQGLDFFKPAQFLCTPHNHLPLLPLCTQTTSYISSHPHLINTYTYTPYAEWYCSSCLPLQILGNETHTLLHCPHSFPLAQPAIHSLMLNLCWFDLWAWATYTDTGTQKVDMLLGSIPPKLDRQHEKANLKNTSPLRVLFSVSPSMLDLFSFYFEQSVRLSFAIMLNGPIAKKKFGNFHRNFSDFQKKIGKDTSVHPNFRYSGGITDSARSSSEIHGEKCICSWETPLFESRVFIENW